MLDSDAVAGDAVPPESEIMIEPPPEVVPEVTEPDTEVPAMEEVADVMEAAHEPAAPAPAEDAPPVEEAATDPADEGTVEVGVPANDAPPIEKPLAENDTETEAEPPPAEADSSPSPAAAEAEPPPAVAAATAPPAVATAADTSDPPAPAPAAADKPRVVPKPAPRAVHAPAVEMAYSASAGKLDAQKQRALDAKRRANALQRKLTKERGHGAAADVEARNKDAGESVRAAARNDTLDRMLRGYDPADEEEVTSLSVIFNTRMRELFEVPSWIKLFRAINTDNSGQISYGELVALARDEQYLHLVSTRVSDGELKRFWLSLDVDRSGTITCGEFGAFMRRGEHVLNPSRSWKESLEDRKRQGAESVRAQRGALTMPAKGLHNLPAASDELVTSLSAMCNMHLDTAVERDEYESPAHTWFSLFKRTDTEHVGQISFVQWAQLVRHTLGVSEELFGGRELRSVWNALDIDGAGSLGAGEYAAFMRKGETKVDRPVASDKRLRVALARRRRAAAVREQDQQLAVQHKAMQQHERRAKKAAARQTREQGREMIERVREEVAAEKKAAYTEIIRRNDQTDLKNALKTAPKASEADVVALAEACNRQLLAIKASDETGTNAPWYRLFKSVDRDGSGQISFDEFVVLLRQDLKLSGLGFEREAIKAAWVAMDEDGSGFISCGEFGKFMRRGMHVLPQPELTWREKIDKKARDAKAARVADRVRLFKGAAVTHELEGAEACADDDVRHLSEHLNARLAEMRQAAAKEGIAGLPSSPLSAGTQYGMWYALFKAVDGNENGCVLRRACCVARPPGAEARPALAHAQPTAAIPHPPHAHTPACPARVQLHLLWRAQDHGAP